MTIIVKHRRTGNEYILLGINGEVDKVNPSRFISELFAQEKSEVSCSVTVCDIRGSIFLAYIDDLTVTEIDGKKPAELLPESTSEYYEPEVYPQQTEDFDDDEDLEEDFDDKPDTSKTPVSLDDSRSSSKQDDLSEDDDWV